MNRRASRRQVPGEVAARAGWQVGWRHFPGARRTVAVPQASADGDLAGHL